VFGAAGQIASASIAAGATKAATQMQIDALRQQRQFVFDQLAPDKIGGVAVNADVQRAEQQLALQGIIDPQALAARYASEGNILGQVQSLGSGQTPADIVGGVASGEAIAGVPGMQDAKNQLVDAALKELHAGATLPPDVQAELAQTGLEKVGMQSGRAEGASGFGGVLLKQILGTAGLQLQAQRQQRAIQLTGAAQSLEQSRQQILGTLFPNLNAVQLKTLQGSQGALAQVNSMAPQAGLGGTDMANLWLARVGATNQLTSQAASIGAQGALAQGQILNQGLGGAVGYGAQALPSTSSVFNTVFGSSKPASSGNDLGDVASYV